MTQGPAMRNRLPEPIRTLSNWKETPIQCAEQILNHEGHQGSTKDTRRTLRRHEMALGRAFVRPSCPSWLPFARNSKLETRPTAAPPSPADETSPLPRPPSPSAA